MNAVAELSPRAEHWPCTNDEYHDDCTRISHSMKEAFRRNRAKFHATYIERTLSRPEPTDAMILGTLLHLCILEPDRWLSSVLCAPPLTPSGECWDRRKKDHKAWWADFLESAAGKQVLDVEQMLCVENMAKALRENPAAGRLLRLPGPTEHSIVWTDERTGMMLKSRRDKVTPGLVLDVKTCRDCSPEGFAKAMANLGYARQAAHYIDGEIARTGEDCHFVFVCVETEPPYRVACYEPDEAALSLGDKQNNRTLAELAVCIQSGQWAEPWEREITALGLPKWAEYQDQWSMSDDH